MEPWRRTGGCSLWAPWTQHCSTYSPPNNQKEPQTSTQVCLLSLWVTQCLYHANTQCHQPGAKGRQGTLQQPTVAGLYQPHPLQAQHGRDHAAGTSFLTGRKPGFSCCNQHQLKELYLIQTKLNK